jgi:hypothetical protein
MLTDRFRQLTTPDSSRWKPMLAGLALSAAGAGAAVLLKSHDVLAMLMTIFVFGAWCMGACAMVGFVRWYFASEVQQMKSLDTKDAKGTKEKP